MKQLFLVFFSLLIASSSLYAVDGCPVEQNGNIYENYELLQHNNSFHAGNIKPFNILKRKLNKKHPAHNLIRFFLSSGFPFFLFAFIISAIGAYTIYGLAVGPLTVLIIYFIVNGRKKEVMKSFWGWIAGTLVGLGVWIMLRVL